MAAVEFLFDLRLQPLVVLRRSPLAERAINAYMKISGGLNNKKDENSGKVSRNHLKRQNATRRSCACDCENSPIKKSKSSLTADTPVSEPDAVKGHHLLWKVNCSQVDDVIKRYLSPNEGDGNNLSRAKDNNDMPTLERQDQPYSISSDVRNDDTPPGPLVAYPSTSKEHPKIKDESNADDFSNISIITVNSDSSCGESIPPVVQDSMKTVQNPYIRLSDIKQIMAPTSINSVIGVTSPRARNPSIKASPQSDPSTYRREHSRRRTKKESRSNTKSKSSSRVQSEEGEEGFRGFVNNATSLAHVLSWSIHYRMHDNQLPRTFPLGEFQITLSKNQDFPDQTPQRLPGLRPVSPVTTVERESSNASLIMNSSIIDMASLSTSTPAEGVRTSRSKRQLSFQSPNQISINEPPVEDDDDLDLPITPILRNSHPPTTNENGWTKLPDGRMDMNGSSSIRVKNGESSLPNPTKSRHERTGTTSSSWDRPSINKEAKESHSQAIVNNQERVLQNGHEYISTDKRPQNIRGGVQEIMRPVIPEEEPEKAVSFATCGLTVQEDAAVARLAQITKSKLEGTFSHETTHLIMNEDSIGCDQYLFAIAYRAIIVTFDWVLLCLDEKKILSPIGFFPKTEEGPCRCQEVSVKPFQDMYFFLGKPRLNSTHLDHKSYQITKTLCENGGADVILDFQSFRKFDSACSAEKVWFYICINHDFHDSILGKDFHDSIVENCQHLRTVPVKCTWISDSIRQYRALPIMNYLCKPFETAVLLEHYGVPKELLAL